MLNSVNEIINSNDTGRIARYFNVNEVIFNKDGSWKNFRPHKEEWVGECGNMSSCSYEVIFDDGKVINLKCTEAESSVHFANTCNEGEMGHDPYEVAPSIGELFPEEGLKNIVAVKIRTVEWSANFDKYLFEDENGDPVFVWEQVLLVG